MSIVRQDYRYKFRVYVHFYLFTLFLSYCLINKDKYTVNMYNIKNNVKKKKRECIMSMRKKLVHFDNSRYANIWKYFAINAREFERVDVYCAVRLNLHLPVCCISRILCTCERSWRTDDTQKRMRSRKLVMKKIKKINKKLNILWRWVRDPMRVQCPCADLWRRIDRVFNSAWSHAIVNVKLFSKLKEYNGNSYIW